MRVVTWNINSVTARMDRLSAWIEQAQPDVLALQELKCTEQAFPAALTDLGYEAVVHATGRWNGVALLSRIGLAEPTIGLPGQPEFDGAVEPRAVGATCGGARVWSVYVPNGREPDHDHYTYKLAWLDCLTQLCSAELAAAPDRPFAVIGDFNIAPADSDVWDISLFAESTHVTPAERSRLQALLDLGLRDLQPRSLKGDPFTFWDYRNGAFHRGWGMRIDLILANAAFAAQVTDCYIDREARKGKGASDHAPVVVDLSFAGTA